LDFFHKRSKLVNDNYENLNDSKFNKQYKEMSTAFLNKTKKQLLEYLKYSEAIQKHNEHKGFDVKKEIFDNNQEAVKFLSQLQKNVNTQPINYLYLKSLHK
jgi:hypothetical protein